MERKGLGSPPEERAEDPSYSRAKPKNHSLLEMTIGDEERKSHTLKTEGCGTHVPQGGRQEKKGRHSGLEGRGA
jgi:hypothetical protein